VRRRHFFHASIGGISALASRVARAQQATKVARFGMLYPAQADAGAKRAEIVLEGLKEKGFVEGRDVELVVRAAGYAPDGLAGMARELAASDVRGILAIGPPAVRAARAATQTLPIVAVDLETDPIATGLIASLAKPGGNITGLFFDFPDFRGKWLELLQEAVPNLRTVAVLWDPTTSEVQRNAAQAAAASRGLGVQILAARQPSDLEEAFATASRTKAQGLMQLSSPLFNVAVSGKQVAELAARYQLPAISSFPEYARVGGLMGYGASVPDMFHQAGALVARVLNGEKPADLPVERPSRLHLIVNLKTARALNLTLPPLLLARADEVID